MLILFFQVTRESHSNLLLGINEDSTILDFEKNVPRIKVPNSVSVFCEEKPVRIILSVKKCLLKKSWYRKKN